MQNGANGNLDEDDGCQHFFYQAIGGYFDEEIIIFDILWSLFLGMDKLRGMKQNLWEAWNCW